jgi:hypothetical protein
MGIEIELPVIEDFEAKVVAAAVDRLMYSTVAGDGESEYGYRVETELQRNVREQMLEVVKEQARAAAPGIAEAILQGEVTITDRYGYSTNKMMTVAELIADTIKNALRDGSTGRTGQGVLKDFIAQEVHKQFRGELAAVLEEAKAPVLEAVRAEAVRVIEGAMQNALAAVGAGKAGRP